MKHYQINSLRGQMKKASASLNRTANSYHRDDYEAFKRDVYDLNQLIQSVDNDEAYYGEIKKRETEELIKSCMLQ